MQAQSIVMQYHTFIVQIDTVVFIQLTQQMFYESILREPIQEYNMKVKREVVLKGTLHKEGVCVCVCVCVRERERERGRERERLCYPASISCAQIPRANGMAGHSCSTLTAVCSTARKGR